MIMISRDRVNVPRDMTIWAARRLREALEVTAALAGNWGRDLSRAEDMMMRAGPDDVIKIIESDEYRQILQTDNVKIDQNEYFENVGDSIKIADSAQTECCTTFPCVSFSQLVTGVTSQVFSII